MEELLYRDRRGTNCCKWDYPQGQFTKPDLLALWVADMDFAAPECVRRALSRQVEFGVFGYPASSEAYYEAFQNWEEAHFSFRPQRAWLRYTPGVVAGFYWMIQILTEPGDAVLIQPPVYYPFKNAVLDTGRTLVCNSLVCTQGVYSVDLADFEAQIVRNRVKAFLLCSPHNPVGRVWTREELCAMLTICRRHGVYVIADEIHQDFVHPGHTQIPAASLEEFRDILVSLTAPSKTFNLAGLKVSTAILPDPELQKRFDAFVAPLRVTDGTELGLCAGAAAYTGGQAWLDAVLETVRGNDRLLREILARRPEITVSPLEGTYLAWVDLGPSVASREALTDLVETRCGLAVDYGHWFGEGCASKIRLNLATRPENIRLAAERLSAAL